MNRRTFLKATGAVCLAGCEARREEGGGKVISREEPDYVLAIPVDMSGSYADLMEKDGRAWKFLLRAMDGFFRERIGSASNDKIVISQISGNDKALLFDGNPKSLRGRFQNSNQFIQFLRSKSSPAGSRVHDGTRETIEYVMGFPGVAEGRTKSAILVLSDLDDNFADRDMSRSRLLREIITNVQAGGTGGFFWVENSLVGPWRRDLHAAGAKDWIVESEISFDPPLPDFSAIGEKMLKR
jgi:hypothetical protein